MCHPSLCCIVNCAIARVPVCAEQKQRKAIFNFPQLLGDERLRARLQEAPGVVALKAAVADWLLQQWPQQETALLAGRAAAVAR
jgi:hypothetical protein